MNIEPNMGTCSLVKITTLLSVADNGHTVDLFILDYDEQAQGLRQTLDISMNVPHDLSPYESETTGYPA